ncbi:MAG: SCPU domain-containing protein [Achromobacter sp.]|nr:SCPU domain-containing protein [Achromobacter sp.]
MFPRALLSLVCMCAASSAGAQSFAYSGNATLGVRVVIANLCSAGSAGAGSTAIAFGKLDFGTHASLSSALSGRGGAGQAGIRVQCAIGVPYRVVLGAGDNDAGPQRRLKGPSGAFVRYGLYSDASLSRPWTEAAPVARAGTGAEEVIPVYAAIEPQATPAAGVYRDTVKVTIQW